MSRDGHLPDCGKDVEPQCRYCGTIDCTCFRLGVRPDEWDRYPGWCVPGCPLREVSDE